MIFIKLNYFYFPFYFFVLLTMGNFIISTIVYGHANFLHNSLLEYKLWRFYDRKVYRYHHPTLTLLVFFITPSYK